MCVLCGVLTVAFTVPIVVNNFTLYYAHAQSRNQLPPQKKRELQQKLIMKNQKATEFIKKLAINVQVSIDIIQFTVKIKKKSQTPFFQIWYSLISKTSSYNCI